MKNNFIKEETTRSEEYREMWKNLGLNLEAHDALLAALGQGYKDIFMTQEGVPLFRVR